MGQRKGRRAKNRADYSTAWRNCVLRTGSLRFGLLQILQQLSGQVTISGSLILNPAVEFLAAPIRPLFASDPTAPQFTVLVTNIGLACHCGRWRWRVSAQGTAGFRLIAELPLKGGLRQQPKSALESCGAGEYGAIRRAYG
jgi:hypothetical protein